MSGQIQIVKEKLNAAITQLCKTAWMFVKNPDRDFTRERKLPLHEVISILLCMEGGSLTSEPLPCFGCNQHTASSSAFIQQRQKINEFAVPSLFYLFVKNTDKPHLYKISKHLFVNSNILSDCARLIMYNFTELITPQVVIRKPNRKHPYKADFLNPLTCHAQMTEKVHPSPDALIHLGATFQNNITSSVTLAFLRPL